MLQASMVQLVDANGICTTNLLDHRKTRYHWTKPAPLFSAEEIIKMCELNMNISLNETVGETKKYQWHSIFYSVGIK